MADVTPKQARYLAYIRAYTEGFGLPPAEAEIAQAIGVSPPSAHLMLKTLEKKGLIRRRSGVPRSIEILIAPEAIPIWDGQRISRTVRRGVSPGHLRIRQELVNDERNYRMATRPMKRPGRISKPDCSGQIGDSLEELNKSELIALLLELARGNSEVARDLAARLAVERPSGALVADVSQAIDRATDFDKRQMNRNFDVDEEAYAEVRQGFELLIQQGHVEDAKLLALKLMKHGSYQVECSDEGLMDHDISECLLPVIRAVTAVGGVEAPKWAKEMIRADRVKYICKKELGELH